MTPQKHAWEMAWTVSHAIMDSGDKELTSLSLSQLTKIRDIMENEVYEYLTQQIQNGKLQLQKGN